MRIDVSTPVIVADVRPVSLPTLKIATYEFTRQRKLTQLPSEAAVV